MYGIYYLMFTTFPNLFSNIYHFSTGVGGLAYIGLGIGFISATIFGAKIADKIYTTVSLSFFNYGSLVYAFLIVGRQKWRQGYTGDANPSTDLWLVLRASWLVVRQPTLSVSS
jgi:predicted MFS family arabinose efflux permease